MSVSDMTNIDDSVTPGLIIDGELPEHAPLPPLVLIDCGFGCEDVGIGPDVSLVGKRSFFAHRPELCITGANFQLNSLGKSHRWSFGTFGYDVWVPAPATYEVTVVFCETFHGNFEVGKRVFHLDVEGTEKFSRRDIDIFKEVGATAILAVTYEVNADNVIQVRVHKGPAENPCISGVIVKTSKTHDQPAVPKAPTLPPASVEVTEAQYEECKAKIKAYDDWKIERAPGVIREEPYCLFHEPGEKVRGLVVTFHGFSGTSYDNRILAKYLFTQGYDVYNTMLASHMYTSEYWPTTMLADEYGGYTLPELAARDDEAQYLLSRIPYDPLSIPRLLERMSQLDPDFGKLPSVQKYVAPLEEDEDRNYLNYYSSTHREYLLRANQHLHLVDAHPGPVSVVGISVGGATALSVAAGNPDRVSRCVTMAPLLQLWEPQPNTVRLLINTLGPMGVIPEMKWNTKSLFPASCLTAAGCFGVSITSSEAIKTAFHEKISMFMVLTADEDAADIPTNQKFFEDCGGTDAGHKYHFYPLSYKVPHAFLDPTMPSRGLRNFYYKSLYQEILRYIATGEISKQYLLSRDVDKSFPIPEDAEPGWHDYRHPSKWQK